MSLGSLDLLCGVSEVNSSPARKFTDICSGQTVITDEHSMSQEDSGGEALGSVSHIGGNRFRAAKGLAENHLGSA